MLRHPPLESSFPKLMLRGNLNQGMGREKIAHDSDDDNIKTLNPTTEWVKTRQQTEIVLTWNCHNMYAPNHLNGINP